MRGPLSRLSLRERLRTAAGRRTAGVVLALVAEGFLALLLLTLGRSEPRGEKGRDLPVTFALSEQATPEPPAPEPPSPERARTPADPQAPPSPEPPRDQPAPSAEAPPPPPEPPPFILTAPGQLAALDRAAPGPPAPRARPAGPADPGGAATARDTPRVAGSGPNGEPLYAAAWYREPEEGELRGYLSTARGPGWALIACRTVPQWRVEDCVPLDEYPDRSGMLRAVLAAAWQFRVRPPMLGGRYKVGEWVRIRISYEERRVRWE